MYHILYYIILSHYFFSTTASFSWPTFRQENSRYGIFKSLNPWKRDKIEVLLFDISKTSKIRYNFFIQFMFWHPKIQDRDSCSTLEQMQDRWMDRQLIYGMTHRGTDVQTGGHTWSNQTVFFLIDMTVPYNVHFPLFTLLRKKTCLGIEYAGWLFPRETRYMI